MADFSTPPQNARTPSHQQPKQMSSRLLNMKFMQRAAAATTPRSATSTPQSSTAHTPATEPLAKRRRIDSTTSSPSATSTPGTPSNGLAYAGSSTPTNAPQNSGLGIAPRGGTSTFTRFEGADTEWVLDLKMRFPGDKRPSHTDVNANDERYNPSRSRFGLLNGQNEQEEEEEEEDEDIWNNNQPSGRQTFGSFDGKRRKLRSSTRQDQGQDQDENDPDLSSASDSDSDSKSDSDEASEHDNIPNSSSRSTPHRTTRGAPAKPTTAELDSDEEMDRVRMAIEQKHRSMMGSGGHGARNTVGTPKAGNKRKREGNGKKNKNKNKKARKTM